jgi:hypothetical protein
MTTKLCKCNTCEAIIERTIAYYGKLIADRECILCAVATARAMGLICEMVVEEQVRGITEERFKGAPDIVKEIAIQGGVEHAMASTSDKIEATWKSDGERFIGLLNEHIDRANKAHEEEQKLQKGD